MSDAILARLTAIEARLAALESGTGARVASTTSSAGRVADDRDLDGQHGNPTVKFDPKRWDGVSHKGLPFSECEPAFLDCYAEALEWSAANPKAGKEKYADYDARDAARARGWAQRKRSAPTSHARTAAPVEDYGTDDSLPF